MGQEHRAPSQPFVSVIVPVYNDAQRIETCITALMAQTYPRDRYEIIVVDNNSVDATRDVIERFPVTLLVEDVAQSSYAARNRGLAVAQGSIVALTDSDCTPAPVWLAEGVRALETQSADLAGGNVRFVWSARPSGAEVCDAMSNLRVEQYIRDEGSAPTANLFVRASVFERVGMFPATVKSGGDRMFTQRATAAGFRLVYAPLAEVAHPTRRLRALLKKQFRVGKGHHAMRAATRTSGAGTPMGSSAPAAKRGPLPKIIRKLRGTFKGFLPNSLREVVNSMRRSNIELTPLLIGRVWAASWASRVATTLGSLSMVRAPKQEVSHARQPNI